MTATQVSGLITSAVINIGLTVFFFLLYSVFRKQPTNANLYFARHILKEKRSTGRVYSSLEKFIPSPGWVKKAWQPTEADILESTGLDAVVYLRIYILCFRFFGICTLVGILVLVPVNYIQGQFDITTISSDTLDRFSISNVTSGSDRLWVHFSVLYCISFLAYGLVYLEYKYITNKRIAFLRTSRPEHDQFTVLVYAIPSSGQKSYSERVEEFFSTYHPYTYLLHHTVYKSGKLLKMMARFQRILKEVESLKLIPESQRLPQRTGMLCFGKKEDPLTVNLRELEDLQRKIKECQMKFSHQENELPIAFVSFKSRWGAAVAAQTQQTPNPLQWVTEWAPEPRDVNWPSLSIPFSRLWMIRLIAGVAFFCITILFFIPAGLVYTLATLQNLMTLFPFIQTILSIPVVSSFISGYLPSLLLTILYYYIPPLMLALTRLEGYPSYSTQEIKTCGKVFLFLVGNSFFLVTYGSLVSLLNQVIESPRQIPALLASAVAGQANFFMNFIMTKGWTGFATEILQPSVLLEGFFLKHIFGKQRYGPRIKPFQYYRTLPNVLLFVFIGFMYAVLAPLVLPFLMIYFLLGYIVYRNQASTSSKKRRKKLLVYMVPMSNGEHIVDVEANKNSTSTYGPSETNSKLAKKSKSRWMMRPLRLVKRNGIDGVPESQNAHEVKNEKSDLLEKVVLTGLLAPDKKKRRANVEPLQAMARLTTRKFEWATHSSSLTDVVAVSYVDSTRRFTIHSFPFARNSWPFLKASRMRMDAHFLAVTSEEALKWVNAFASVGCFVNCSQHPFSASKRQGSVVDAGNSPPGMFEICPSGRVMLVILNPCSGRGRARKVYNSKVEPILKLAGFKLNVVETTGPHHAYKLAANVDLSTCEDGIICVGGDGIINEVLNGLLSRENAKSSRAIPIGIIPAGSDNSLIWTVMGIKDPSSAAIAIVKGDLISTDIFAVEWTKTGDLHMGHTVAYYGFMSDVLELSEKYQKRFGPLRYFVAGALKFFCLPSYDCELEYLPVEVQDHLEHSERQESHSEIFSVHDVDELSDDKSDAEGGLRMVGNSLPTNDLVSMAPFRLACEDLLTGPIDAMNEPSEYVRGLDHKTKRLSSNRSPVQAENEEVISVNHFVAGTTPSPRSRTRCRSNLDRGLSGLSNGSLRSSWDCSGESPAVSLEGISKSFRANRSLPEGCIYMNNSFQVERDVSLKRNSVSPENEQWIVRQGPFLGIMICNHKCKTVQCLNSQVLAPTAQHDDNALDLVLVRRVGRLQLLRFFIAMQFGRHLSLPFVEYKKVRSVKLKPGNNAHKGCGIDGELLALNGPISTNVLPEQCQLIGYSIRHN